MESIVTPIELLLIPLTLIPGLVAHLISGLRRTPPADPEGGATQPAAPSPNRGPSTPRQTPAADPTAGPEETNPVPDIEDGSVTGSEPRNRAERRAQQQAQANVKRTRARH